VLPIDGRVLAEGFRIHREGGREFYGLQVANRLGTAKIGVYRSLRRLTELGLVDRWWEDQDVATSEGRPRRRLYSLNERGEDALPYALGGRRALGRQWPPDSNGTVSPTRDAPFGPLARRRARRALGR
jgi:DNA-binding PadR family transcriptional regulator